MSEGGAAQSAYDRLHGHFEQIGHLRHAQAMLEWDEAVMMPPGGGSTRAEAMAALAGAIHRLESAPELGELTASAREREADQWRRANIGEMQRIWRHASAVPGDLVVALTRAGTTCEQIWRTAREANDWKAVSAPLAEVVGLTRERAQALADAAPEPTSPYDALLDEYEPGLTRTQIDPIFAELRGFLPDFIEAATAAQAPLAAPEGPFPEHRQEALGRRLMAQLGFDFERGRIDISHHPFCGGEPDDTRITTRYDTGDFLKSLFAVLHETGHALYQQGLPSSWRGQPVGDAGGMALHESQSLLMEMQVCRGKPFLSFAAPVIRDAFPEADTTAPEWSTENLLRLATRVERGLIRVDADEATYPLHVILRYELETRLLDGSLAVADIPDAWDEKMRSYLGLTTAGDFRDGCMQDVHWFCGLIGYFPTYTLGAVTAAQFWRAARDAVPGVEEGIGSGDFAPLLDWLRANIHSAGRLLTGAQIVERATGKPLGTEAFIEHLRGRYPGAGAEAAP